MKTIITHNGTFHCDEALAYSLLTKLNDFKVHKLIRTRDPEVIKSGDVVIDVGAVFDPSTNRFDHHQRGFEEVFGVDKFTRTKLSSAGLVYKYFGKQLFREHYGIEDDKLIDTLYVKVYANFIESVDGIDNGVAICPAGATPNYLLKSDLSSRVSRLNPRWNEPEGPSEDERFLKAAEMCFEEFDAHASDLIKSWWPARKIVEESFAARFDVHPSGKIVDLKQFCPWKEHMEDLETENGLDDKSGVLYVVFQDTAGSFRVGTLSTKEDSFKPRKPLPENLRGLRDEQLSSVAGIDGLIFVHASGFIGGARTKQGALELAKKALEEGEGQ